MNLKQIAQCLHYHVFTVSFKSGIVNLVTLLFQDWFVYSWSFVFSYEIYKNCIRNTITFPKMTLHPHTLPNILIKYSWFLKFFSSKFTVYTIMSSANKHGVFFFLILMPLTFKSLRTSSVILNRSGRSELLCFVPDLKGKHLIFCYYV